MQAIDAVQLPSQPDREWLQNTPPLATLGLVHAYDGETYEARRFAAPGSRRRLRVMERVILRHVQGRNRVLDLGCGTGRLAVQIRAREVIGLDRNLSMLTVARRRNVKAVRADANDMPFAAETFDAVVATDHFFHWVEQRDALADCARILVDSGILAMHYGSHAHWSPRRPWRLTRKPGLPGLPADKLIELSATYGFELIELRLWRWLRFYPYLIPMPPDLQLQLWSQGVLIFRKSMAAR